MILVLKLPDSNALNARVATISVKIRQLAQHVQSQTVVSATSNQERYAMFANQHFMGMGQILAQHAQLLIVMFATITLDIVINVLKDIY